MTAYRFSLYSFSLFWSSSFCFTWISFNRFASNSSFFSSFLSSFSCTYRASFYMNTLIDLILSSRTFVLCSIRSLHDVAWFFKKERVTFSCFRFNSRSVCLRLNSSNICSLIPPMAFKDVILAFRFVKSRRSSLSGDVKKEKPFLLIMWGLKYDYTVVLVMARRLFNGDKDKGDVSPFVLIFKVLLSIEKSGFLFFEFEDWLLFMLA